jgi:hypothetical protein
VTVSLQTPLSADHRASLRAESARWWAHKTDDQIEAGVRDKIANLAKIERDGYIMIFEKGYNGRPPRMGYWYREDRSMTATSYDAWPAALLAGIERGIAPVLDFRGVKSWDWPMHRTGMTAAEYVAAAVAGGAILVSGEVK